MRTVDRTLSLRPKIPQCRSLAQRDTRHIHPGRGAQQDRIEPHLLRCEQPADFGTIFILILLTGCGDGEPDFGDQLMREAVTRITRCGAGIAGPLVG